ncbi:MAG: glycoside hydrolase family 3 C-terminal domain-containing protein [Mediterranea sp.]|jgi:beta-glucosidase|nr:glycoside hydrolase family 3 C-terminal domain-containing protein [Mediterranea sp.]
MKKKVLYLILLLLPLLGGCHAPAYKNSSLTAEERAEDLLGRLTPEEKVLLMMDDSKPVDRLGIKPYNWWNEALHGVARAGLATVFPQPIGMAASFDPDAVHRVFDAVSDEARAKHTHAAAQGSHKRYQGLTVWTPTINIYRDPRWGRGIETYGEDPYLTGVMGVEVVKALQGPKDRKYDKLHACAKHFAVHSGPEWNRHTCDAANIKPRDLYETYLPSFEALVKEAKVEEVMCAYNRFEGDPCCGSNRLLMQILRGDWGYEGIVVADCGAISDFYRDKGHKTHPDVASASADGVLKGTDLDCGTSYASLTESLQKGLITEKDLDASVRRLLKARFALGEMDDPKKVEWTSIPYHVVASDEHNELSLEMARKSMTLLANKNNALPLKRGGLTVAVIGPNANDSVMQWGNYNGTPPRTITILDGIRAALAPDDKLIYEQGCSWVERTLLRSAFGDCTAVDEQGFIARYWNNKERDGQPAATVRMTTPFRLCTSGATVFAPGVNLTNFAATYNTVFTPSRTGEVVFDLYSCGAGKICIDGKEVKSFRNTHGGRKTTHEMTVEAGKAYDLQLEFEDLNNDAQLNFDLGYKEEINIHEAVNRVKEAHVVIFAGGISPFLEGEEMGVNLPGFKGGDRTDIELPAVQRELIKALADAGKKVILVNCSGSPIGFVPETETCAAILQAWYPGQSGGKAVAEVLFGDYNPAGRLPVTFYRNVSQLPGFEDYNMTGRTYRYMTEEPLFPFGYGLSYTTFEYGKPQSSAAEISADGSLSLTVPVKNTGKRDGDEVVQVYLRKKGDADGPVKALRAFRRVHIPAGRQVEVKLELTGKQLEWWDEASNTMRVHSGSFDVMVGSSSRAQDLQAFPLVIR